MKLQINTYSSVCNSNQWFKEQTQAYSVHTITVSASNINIPCKGVRSSLLRHWNGVAELDHFPQPRQVVPKKHRHRFVKIVKRIYKYPLTTKPYITILNHDQVVSTNLSKLSNFQQCSHMQMCTEEEYN